MRTIAAQVDEPLRRVALQIIELFAGHHAFLELLRGGRQVNLQFECRGGGLHHLGLLGLAHPFSVATARSPAGDAPRYAGPPAAITAVDAVEVTCPQRLTCWLCPA